MPPTDSMFAVCRRPSTYALIAAWLVGCLWALQPRPVIEVEVVAATDQGTPVELFIDQGQGFDEPDASVWLIGDGSFHRLHLVANASTAVRVRIDPRAGGGPVELAEIVVESAAGTERWQGKRLDLWQVVDASESRDRSRDRNTRRFETEHGNPQLHLEQTFEPRTEPALLPPSTTFLIGLPWILLLAGWRPERLLATAAVVVPAAVLLAVLHWPASTSWWTVDDPCLLVEVMDYGLLGRFSAGSSSFVIPLQTMSLGVDLELFGLEPRAFYWHHLISFVVLLATILIATRRTFSPAGRATTLLLVVLAPSSFAILRQLMNRHYLEGTVLTLIAIHCYRRSATSGSSLVGWLGALAYLAAMAAKEVFVPLALLLPLLAPADADQGTRARRWISWMPFAATLVLYAIWRAWLLAGNTWSAYGSLAPQPRPDHALQLLADLGYSPPAVVVILSAVLFAGWKFVARGSSRGRWLLFAGTAALLTAPLVPVAGSLAPRHLFLPSVIVALLIASTLEQHPRFGSRLVALVIVCLTLDAGAQATITTALTRSANQYELEGRAVLEDSGEQAPLLTTIGHNTFLGCLSELRQRVRGVPTGSGFCGDPCFCFERYPSARVRVPENQEIIPGLLRIDTSCQGTAPLDLELSHQTQTDRLSWSFSSPVDGTFATLLVDAVEPLEISQPFPVPATGSLAWKLEQPVRLVVRHRDPAGVVSYSGILEVGPNDRVTVDHRSAPIDSPALD